MLQTIGFVSANRGWVLNRVKRVAGKPLRLHALVEIGNVINLHEDFMTKDQKHETRRTPGRMSFWRKLLESIDNGTPIEIPDKMRRNYNIKSLNP